MRLRSQWFGQALYAGFLREKDKLIKESDRAICFERRGLVWSYILPASRTPLEVVNSQGI